jgi:hypothetical protein
MLKIEGFTSGFIWRAVYQNELVGEVVEEKSVGAACTNVAAADD